MKLTSRMENWIEKLGIHFAVADKKGFPIVIVSEKVDVDGEIISIALTLSQVTQIKNILTENNSVAIAPAGIGSIRAPYQFKGPGVLKDNTLTVKIEEIYCTKPGAEAGIRLDTLGFEEMKNFDQSRWEDLV